MKFSTQFLGLQIADKLNLLNLVPLAESTTSEWIFTRNKAGHLSLHTPLLPNIKPISIDFCSAVFKRKLNSLKGKNQLVNKAVPFSEDASNLLDLTAGFGEDAFCFANRGFRVTAIERNPLLYLLLVDALQRFFIIEPENPICRESRLRFVFSEAKDFLETSVHGAFDIIYFDPMFQKEGTALSSGRMQILQTLLKSETPPSEQLLQLAKSCARRRLVVKRGIQTPDLIPHVSHSFRGKAVRYDMYVSQN